MNLQPIRTYASFVRFSHSVFALPFALTGALLAMHARSSQGNLWDEPALVERIVIRQPLELLDSHTDLGK